MVDNQKGFTVWLTGLSGSGKSTIARHLIDALRRRGVSSIELLDGDEVRQHLSKGLGFSKEDRDTNILRIGYVASLLARNGVVAVAAAISPYRDIRDRVRRQIRNFLEVYVSAPLDVLIERDVKGLYKKALAGEIQNFTGISDPYEVPTAPEVIVETDRESVEVSVAKVLRALELLRWIPIVETALSEEEEERVISQLHASGRILESVDLSPLVRASGLPRRPRCKPFDLDERSLSDAIPPHGGVLVNRVLSDDDKNIFIDNIERYPSLTLTRRQWSDIILIANGAYSPLSGFVGRKEYLSIIRAGRLTNGLAWTIPIVLLSHDDEAEHLKIGEDVILRDRDGKNLAVLHLEEIYRIDKEEFALSVWQTTDDRHPAVKHLYDEGSIALAGSIDALRLEYDPIMSQYHLTPLETREYFRANGWKTVAAFQTRNPVHRAHEYIQKVALELVDGLLLHPLVGETKEDDIPAEVRMECYRVLLANYYPSSRVLLSVMPAAMRYAGPREAIHHAIIRQNYGCSHFIVGRDHAGIGTFYGTYDAHRIFDEYSKEELAITPLKFENSFYCARCESVASERTCPHPQAYHVSLSGTKVREHLELGLSIPREFSRPEVIEILRKSYSAQRTTHPLS